MTDDTKVQALAQIVAGLADTCHALAEIACRGTEEGSSDEQYSADAMRDAAEYRKRAQALGDAPDGAQWLEVPAPQSEAHVKTPPRAMLGYSQFSHLAGVETATRGTPVSSPPPGPTSANAESGGAVEVWGVYSRRGILFAAAVTADEAQRYPAAYDASRPAGAPHYVVHLVPASRLDAAERERDEARDWQQKFKAEYFDRHAAVDEQLRAKLDAAERERDGALDLVKIRTDSRNRWKGCAYEQFGVVDQLRADLARVTEQRNEAQDQYLAEQARADALQRRIEGGIKCWRFGDGSTVLHKPSADDRADYGPFTPGRFVADETQGGT